MPCSHLEKMQYYDNGVLEDEKVILILACTYAIREREERERERGERERERRERERERDSCLSARETMTHNVSHVLLEAVNGATVPT